MIEQELFMFKSESESSKRIFFKYSRDTVKIRDAHNSFTNVGRLVLEAKPKNCFMQYRYFFPENTQIIDSMTINVMCASKCVKKTIKNVKAYFTFLGGYGWRKISDGVFISKRRIKISDNSDISRKLLHNTNSYILAKWEKITESGICYTVSFEIIKMDVNSFKKIKNVN